MAARKANKAAVRRRGTKKAAVKKQVARPTGKTATKRTRRASTSKSAAKTPRTAVRAQASATSAKNTHVEPDRKPVKIEPRPSRPPAQLPIPQATFFF